MMKSHAGQFFAKFRAGIGNVHRVENGRDNTNAPRARHQHVIQGLKIDPTYGKPRNGHLRRRPPDVVKRHRLGGRFGAGGVNRSDGNVIRPGFERALRLRGSVSGQTNQGPDSGVLDLGNMGVAGVEKIFLPQMADVSPDFTRDVQMIIDDKAGVRAACDGENFFRHAPDVIWRRIFGTELNQVAAAIAELLCDQFRREAMQIGRVHERVKLAIRERFHKDSLIKQTGENRGNKDGKWISAIKIAGPIRVAAP